MSKSGCLKRFVARRHVLLIMLAAAQASAQPEAIARAPAFDPAALVELPARNWITNGGNLFNQRYSALDQINRDNIGEVKAVWRVSLNGSGMEPGFSQQAQALAYEGTIFVVTGANDVFAVDVETGRFDWVHEADVDYDKAVACCGRLSRGLGLGDGRIYLGQLDGRLIALDQQTGDVVWDVLAGDPDLGYGITAAPLYYDNKVIVGFTGGEYGARGRISAYDAATGGQVWNFYTIPGPGEIGHTTWPQGNDAWMYGGAPVWQTPSIDPELGLIYFVTGNAGPDLNGANRAGDNLFTVSLLALDVESGEYRWHFQLVRHDIWDYDAANPTILFDAEFDGVPRKGITAIAKNGHLFILDRTTGVPLTPVVETPVPQEPLQKTAATQPIPQGDTVVRHDIDVVGEDFDGTLTNRGQTFNPFNADEYAYWRPFSGVTWHPSSYNIESNLMYICAADGAGGGRGGDPNATIGPEADSRTYVQGSFGSARDIGADTRYLLVAMNLTNHEVAWRRLLDQRCAGSITTAGGLIFAGRFNGEFTALDSTTGRRLWSFQTDGGFMTTATSFEHNGTQYLAGLAGGSLSAGRQNDGLWLFSLDGSIESLPPGSGDRPAGGRSGSGADAGAATLPDPLAGFNLARAADPARGGDIYRTVCQTCHGENGQGGHAAGAPLTAELTLETILRTATDGISGTAMMPFRDVYSLEQLHDVASFIVDEVLP